MRPMPAFFAVISAALFAAATGLAVQPPANQPPPPPPPPGAQSEQPPAPKGIPVPDMPVIKKTELEGGLIAEDMKIGEGYEVKPGGTVVAHYHGTLKNGGMEFDSSFKRGEPIAFPLGNVIQGWQKGVPGMKVGGVRRLTVPAAMGYGPSGTPDGSIPPNADLVFVIEIVDALQIEDIKVGEGEPASGENRYIAVTAHIMKDKDGKELEKFDAAKPYIWFPGELKGLELGMDGMKVGGKRRILIPKELNSVPAQPGSARPQDAALTMEIELVAVRNLPGR